ncbi:D-alanine--D-alanine ligase [Brevibacillus centrosporus]|uniref:D-alanine--D-alanine ligase n=1 Tax=Brevibacillus centrosporus TaxID=54910 RepID=A0A1I3WBH9_9BACL|nr:D-alanine--D-alanine ligase [Brevibacillus centrosporus]MEC2130931.1 D-alanine--D-alanine ligase [Brevibacillus centrosporus]MED4907554.1 D-alanine--D-alanine ligase [Brevibacillus centrosporus]RNB63406.1 D-alanine--D-alanine ligase [Brevibacillus centrosporus]SFK04760.1 D-alanine-D-alanine ligase [Brevibacillus centrosporus]GED31356.1 D-alanine--D-alanine ligase [Brevibacillus centrosporus]
MGSEKIRLGIIYGGKSSEHEVSLRTAMSIMQAVDAHKYEVTPIYVQLDGSWVKGEVIAGQLPEGIDALRLTPGRPDEINNQEISGQQLVPSSKPASLFSIGQQIDVIFPVVHGPNGEDGTMQGMLELANLPYVGAGVMASAVGMDKWMMKTVFGQVGLPQVKYIGLLRSQWEKDQEAAMDRIEEELGFPCFVKPANMGSSVGVNKAKNRDELAAALDVAAKFDRRLIVEEFVNARELEIGVLGNEELITSVVGEIIAAKEFYDYEAKYKGAGTELSIPANVPEHVSEQIAEIAKKAFHALDGSGLSRVDFFWDEKNDKLYINEVNTMPGFTPFSMYPMLFQAAGISYSELIDRLVQLGIERHADKQRNIVDAEELE